MTKDGDPKDFNQINNTIEYIIPNTKRIGYDWHIVIYGFEIYVVTTFPDLHSLVIDNHKRIILNCIYSCTKTECSIYLWYQYSWYNLFMKYISDQRKLSICV